MKIICIGRNYASHAKELNNELPEKPVVFFKPDTALLKNNSVFYYPNFTNELHYEVELVFRICKSGKHIQKKFAHKYYEEIGIGIDFTARDLQNECKRKSLPWEIAKSFDGSAPVGDFISKKDFPDLKNISFSLNLNGKVVQKGNSANMIFSIDEIIEYASSFFTLKPGDLIFTGTPEGVGSVKKGDTLVAFIENSKSLAVEIK
jgi:2-keto-4-pentenoate hydratase/2-oxohepta-3-ene-1,7-dioic acid hydratase in catechol pathway